ncbi:multicopper oxidase-domain-containing protein [Aspergillus carlsbadensis]|nr:multicopper oxidase-domain-containing protein [Aspergillus carlsbadensis]
MDGPPGLTQCNIPPNETMVYNFTIDQSGTYKGQYPDGWRQALVIHDEEDPYIGKYNKKLVISLSDCAFFNGIAYVAPNVPVLYSVLTTGSAATNAAIYGTDTNAFVFDKGDVIDIVLNNDDTGKHPFHLHGHNFQVLWHSGDDEGHYNPDNATFASIPVRRDTPIAPPSGNFLVRFIADNPGVWFFHCHIEWHMDAGLAAVMVEVPLYLQEHLTIPQNHYDVCAASRTLTAGNAAGNTEDFYDLTGENRAVAPLPAGFTARGIVALVFSCVVVFLGLASIVWSVGIKGVEVSYAIVHHAAGAGIQGML